MMRPARVVAVETLSPRFRLIDLGGEALKGVAWLPGQKVQVAIGLAQATVIERREGDAHLAAIGADLSRHVPRGTRFVLTGKAQSIESVSKALEKSSVAPSSVKSKVTGRREKQVWIEEAPS